MPTQPQRLQVVDALRGFAIVSIMLLHNVEHFDLYFRPTGFPEWLVRLDSGIWTSLFFLFSGKSYAIFALLFGLTFALQDRNQQEKGRDFRARFAWRLLLLFGFGLLNSTFYQGDILMIYSILGCILIFTTRLPTRWVFLLALLLMLQPYTWYLAWQGYLHPAAKVADPVSWSYFGKASDYLTKDSLLNTWIGNLTNGRHAVLLWTWETGRALQTCSLFLLGMLAGRLALFDTTRTSGLWRRILLWALVCFAALSLAAHVLPQWVPTASVRSPLNAIRESWANMAFMVVLISTIVLAHRAKLTQGLVNLLSPIGRMSLTNYLAQSLVGTVIYYGFGLGLYKYTGATLCLGIGILLALLQALASHWWLRSHKQGPLETLWHKATWLGANNKTV